MSEQPRGNNDEWRAMLLGTHPGLVWLRRVFGAIPADQRCKVCLAPHAGPAASLSSRRLELRGRAEPLDAWSEQSSTVDVAR